MPDTGSACANSAYLPYFPAISLYFSNEFIVLNIVSAINNEKHAPHITNASSVGINSFKLVDIILI